MKVIKFFILFCFLGKYHCSYFFTKLLSGWSNDESGSEGDVIVPSEEEYDYSNDDLPHYVDERGIGGFIYEKATDIYNFWTVTKKDDETKTKHVPKSRLSKDEFVMTTGAQDIDEEILNENKTSMVDKEDEVIEESNSVLIAKSIEDNNNAENEKIPVATVAKRIPVVIPEERVQSYNDDIPESEDEINELKGKTLEKKHISDVNSFIEKVNLSPFGNIRPRSTPIPLPTSPYYQDILNLLQESYMGEFDFRSIKPMTSRTTSLKPKNYKDMLLKGYLGEIWMNKNWEDLDSNISTELSKQIKDQLNIVAIKTMNNLPSLAPKTTYERDVLEGWLIDGLLLAYPNLSSGVTKNDAIALIIIAVLSKSFINSENDQVILHLVEELEKYIGDLPDKFPINQFKYVSDQSKELIQEKMLESLFRIIEDKNLGYSSKVIEDIERRIK